MSKAEEYQNSYEECFKPEDTVSSLSYLVENMIETIQQLEGSASKEYQAKRFC